VTENKTGFVINIRLGGNQYLCLVLSVFYGNFPKERQKTLLAVLVFLDMVFML
jgi:hypothetical protein